MTKTKMLRGLFLFLLLGSAAAGAEPFTLVMVPDTQGYADIRRTPRPRLRHYFPEQMQWIADSADKLNTVFALHVGDIVQTDFPAEWAWAKKAISRLEGRVPIALAAGNHDMGFDIKKRPPVGNSHETHMDEYFPREAIAGKPWFGGSMDGTLENAWYKFERAGMKFMIVALEYKPREEAVRWAGKVIESHPDRRVIVLTHGYLDKAERGGDRLTKRMAKYGKSGLTGQQLWDELISQHENIFMVVCGHITGRLHRVDRGVHGNQVHQILIDYQSFPEGGGSWLGYMTFRPSEDRIDFYAYNPAQKRFGERKGERFSIPYPMPD